MSTITFCAASRAVTYKIPLVVTSGCSLDFSEGGAFYFVVLTKSQRRRRREERKKKRGRVGRGRSQNTGTSNHLCLCPHHPSCEHPQTRNLIRAAGCGGVARETMHSMCTCCDAKAHQWVSFPYTHLFVSVDLNRFCKVLIASRVKRGGVACSTTARRYVETRAIINLSIDDAAWNKFPCQG